MSWSISVLENTLSLNDAQRAGLAPILERCGHAGEKMPCECLRSVLR